MSVITYYGNPITFDYNFQSYSGSWSGYRVFVPSIPNEAKALLINGKLYCGRKDSAGFFPRQMTLVVNSYWSQIQVPEDQQDVITVKLHDHKIFGPFQKGSGLEIMMLRYGPGYHVPNPSPKPETEPNNTINNSSYLTAKVDYV